MTKLVIGCGYLGQRVAAWWLAHGDQVAVVTRSEHRSGDLGREGFSPIVADVSHPDTLPSLPQAQTVLYAVGYDRRGGVPRKAVVVDGLRNVLEALPASTGRLIFISSTGVMGGHHGQWVDETSPCRPEREAGVCGLEAEELLRSHGLGNSTVVLRLAGLYGPGRLPKLADVQSGRPVAAPDRAYLNLIHVEDAVQAVLAAERSANPSDLYLVSDGTPTRHREFYGEMARQLGLPVPVFTAPESGSRGAAAAAGNKRVNNARMLKDLSVRLRYPTYRDGLRAVCSELRGHTRQNGETG